MTAAAARERFIVRFDDEAAGRKLLEDSGARVVKELGRHRAVAVLASPRAMEALEATGRFARVEPDPVREPLAQTTPYGITMVQAPQVWEPTAAAPRKICVIDSGYTRAHEDLYSENVTGSPAGWDRDLCGHGTHVAGTITAPDNATGVVGVNADRPPLHIVKVFGDDCRWSYASDLIAALDECRAAGASIVNMSLGGGGRSVTEETAFAEAFVANVLPIAAAGNGGSTAFSYPASYASVVSVAAIDSSRKVASFSQRNAEVDLAAPGVAVLSTIGVAERRFAEASGTRYSGYGMSGAADTAGTTGALADGGLCDSVGAWTGKVVLCKRGSISFASKVANVKSGGGVAALIYNDVSGDFSGTLGAEGSTLPALSLSRANGEALLSGAIGASTTVVSETFESTTSYASMSGTSMAAPHVAGVAALVWGHFPTATAAEVRNALEATAVDLGVAGRDDSYGKGLPQAKAAFDALQVASAAPEAPVAPPVADFGVQCDGRLCAFEDRSTDADGAVVSHRWEFAGPQGAATTTASTSTERSPSLRFTEDGTYKVRLTVTDDSGATGSAEKQVSVEAPVALTLTARSDRTADGVRRVYLAWSGATTPGVELFRNGERLASTENDGFFEDASCLAGEIAYRVCHPETAECSPEVSVAEP